MASDLTFYEPRQFLTAYNFWVFVGFCGVKRDPEWWFEILRNGGGSIAWNNFSGRGEAKSLARLRNMVFRSVYAGPRLFPTGRDWKFQMSFETPLLINGRDGLAIPYVA